MGSSNCDISAIRSQTEPLCGGLGSSILLLEVTLKHGTLVCVFVGCYRIFATPLNNVVVTTRHVTTRIGREPRVGISPFVNRSTHHSKTKSDPKSSKVSVVRLVSQGKKFQNIGSTRNMG